MFRVAFIGFGGIAHSNHINPHFEFIKEGKTELVAVCDIRPNVFDKAIAINIGIGTYYNLAPAQVLYIEGSQVFLFFAAYLNAAAQHLEQVCNDVAGENAGVVSLEAVEYLASYGHNALELSIAALFARAHGGVALHDVELAAGNILGAAVHKLFYPV